jgi:hypothetical protein
MVYFCTNQLTSENLMDAKTFKNALSAFISSTTTQRDKLELILVAGLAQVQESGNTVYLTASMDACTGVRSLPTSKIKNYILAHATNLKYSKNKDGNLVFSKAEKGADIVITMPLDSERWYIVEKEDKESAGFDVPTKILAMLKTINAAGKAGKISEEQMALAGELCAQLSALVPAAKIDK